MFELDNRQIATLVWFGVVIFALTIAPRVRRVVLPALRDVLETMATWKIIVPFAAYFLYAAVVIFVADQLGFWNQTLLTDTLIVIFFVGLPMFMNANKAKDGDRLIKNTLRGTLSISALLVFYIGIEPFSLIGEIILQPIVTLLVMLNITARKPEQKSAKRLIDGILAILGAWLVAHTTAVIISSWTEKEVDQSIGELLLSVLLPLALLPTIYIFAVIMRYESLVFSLPNFRDKTRLPLQVWLAIIVHLNIRLGLLGDFTGIWRQQLARTNSYQEASFSLQKLKKAVRKRDRKLRDYRRHMRKATDVRGVDQNGLQIDRREYYESKTSLKSLLYMQMGQFRNIHQHYNPDFPIEIALLKLSKENHGIHMKVRNDKRAWFAWRQLPNGYYFGVGGTPHVDDVWLYDGINQPTLCPSKSIRGWAKSVNGSASAEWGHNDEPPEQLTPPT